MRLSSFSLSRELAQTYPLLPLGEDISSRVIRILREQEWERESNDVINLLHSWNRILAVSQRATNDFSSRRRGSQLLAATSKHSLRIFIMKLATSTIWLIEEGVSRKKRILVRNSHPENSNFWKVPNSWTKVVFPDEKSATIQLLILLNFWTNFVASLRQSRYI